MPEPNHISREGEHRNVTVMFADISGFTSMSEKTDPETTISVINDCFATMGEVIERHGGTIDKYIGDCVMAIFGAPAAIEESPRNALNAAIEICNWMDHYNASQQLDHPLGVHIGVNSGMVVAGLVGSGGKKEYTVMGDAVNVASRLKDISHSGEIFVGNETYRYARQYFSFSPLESLKLKGKEIQVKAWSLVSRSEKVHRTGIDSGRNIGSVMVGRHKELDKLSLELLKLINGKGGIISIIGEAGVGKSRLMAEFRNREEISRVRLIEGRSLSFGKNLFFHPIIDCIKNWAEISENDSEKLAYQKLNRHIRTILSTEAHEVFPFIATMMGMELSAEDSKRLEGIEGAAMESLVLKSLDMLVVKASSRRPLIIVLEDVHWADRSSIDLLSSLYRLSLQYPVSFINLMRPSYPETGEHILEIIRSRYPEINTEIFLKVLDQASSEQLINNLLRVEGFPIGVKNTIIRQTGGNPFFIEEIIRSFIDEGLLEKKGNSFLVSKRIDAVEVPATINDVLMARIDRLDESARTLLKTAAVIGRKFFYRILEKVYNSPQELELQLEYLIELQFIRKQEGKTELQYIFRHALAQEAAYNSILHQKRKKMHLQTAKAIEEEFADKLPEFYGMLAMHYIKAEDFNKAEEYLVKAGEIAIKSSASSDAIHYFSEALRIYSERFGNEADPRKILHFEISIGTAHMNKGQLGEAFPYYKKALNYYGIHFRDNKFELYKNVLLAIVNLNLALRFRKWGFNKLPDERQIEIIDLNNKLSFSSAFVSDQMAGIGSFWVIRKMIPYDPGKCPEAAQLFLMSCSLLSYAGVSFKLHRKALSFFNMRLDYRDTRTMINYKFSEAINRRFEGRWYQMGFDEALVEDSLKLGITQETSSYLLMECFVDFREGNFKDAEKKILKLNEIGSLFDFHTAASWHLILSARLALARRDLNGAIDFANQHIEYSKKINDLPPLFWGYSTRAMAEILLDNPKEAEKSLELAKQYLDGHKLVVYETTYVTAEFMLGLDKLKRAQKHGQERDIRSVRKATRATARKALKIAETLADNRIENYRNMGTYYWLRGKNARAVKWWNKAIKMGETSRSLPELARSYMEIGKRIAEKGHAIKAFRGMAPEANLKKAGEIFSELKLYWDLEQMENS